MGFPTVGLLLYFDHVTDYLITLEVLPAPGLLSGNPKVQNQ